MMDASDADDVAAMRLRAFVRSLGFALFAPVQFVMTLLVQWMENLVMNIVKKASVALAVASMTVAPVAASAAPVARVEADMNQQSELKGGSIILALLAAAAIIAGIIIAADGTDDAPTSP